MQNAFYDDEPEESELEELEELELLEADESATFAGTTAGTLATTGAGLGTKSQRANTLHCLALQHRRDGNAWPTTRS